LNFVNPRFKVKDDNIFLIRENEYKKLEENIISILEPVKELDFEIIDFGIRDPKFASGELQRTLRKSLVIKLQKGTSVIDLSMQIPKLINGNYIVINGRI
jgi:hypothetical protein